MPQDEDIENFEKAEKDRRNRIVKSHAAQMAEHFDSVQIVATQYDPQDGTAIFHHGEGNYYAREASVERWLKKNKKS